MSEADEPGVSELATEDERGQGRALRGILEIPATLGAWVVDVVTVAAVGAAHGVLGLLRLRGR